MSVTVSILITVFNCASYISESVSSALSQDFDDFELVVVDDGSTDGTREFLDSIADKRLKLLDPGRLGRPRALNFGIHNSLGQYVAILDADDISFRSRLSAEVGFLRENPNVAIVGSRYKTYVDEGANPIREEIEPMSFGEISSKFRTNQNPMFHSSVMFNRAIVQEMGGYDTSLACLVDWDLYVRVAARFEIRNIDARLSLKRIHERQFFGGRHGVHFGPEATHASDIIRERTTLLPMLES